MTSSELDPELYKEIWGEYPPEQSRADSRPSASAIPLDNVDAEVVTQARLLRETVLAALDPRLDALEVRLAAIESRIESIERELKELVNRGVGRGREIDGGGYRGTDAAQ